MNKKILCTSIIALTSLFTIVGCGPENSGSDKHTYNTYMEVNPKTWNVHRWETNDESYIMSFTEMGLYDVILNSKKDGYEFANEMAADRPVDVSRTISDEEMQTYYPNALNPTSGTVWEIKLNQAAKFASGTQINADTYVDSLELQLNPHLVNRRADSFYASSFVIANAEKYFKQQRSTIEPAYDYIDLEKTSSPTLPLKDKNFGKTGNWYLNLGATSPYGNSVFSGEVGEQFTFYQVLNNRVDKGSVALQTACGRITDAASYWAYKKFVDGGSDPQKMHDPDNWKDVKGLSDVGEDQLNENIDISDFDVMDIYVRNSVNPMIIDPSLGGAVETTTNEDNDPSTFEKYSWADLQADLRTVVSSLGRGGATSASWNYYLPLFSEYFNDYEVDFSNVGIRKVDDYTIRIYLEKSITQLDLLFQLSSNWIVNVDLYKSLIRSVTGSEDGSTQTTLYASGNAANYDSYGPYKLVTFTDGSFIDIQKNESWYGWTDGKHENQFETDAVYTRIIQSHETAKQEFLNGKLDDFTLDANDMGDYGASSRAKTTPESYTSKLSFNTSESMLEDRQSDGINKTILASRDFRQGLSLGIDRVQLASNSAGSTASTNLLNSLYLTDVEKGEVYRDTAQGRSVYGQVYGAEGFADEEVLIGKDASGNYSNSIGYNRNLGVQKMAKAIREYVDEGKMKTTDKIEIEYLVYDQDSTATVGIRDYLNETLGSLAKEIKTLLANPTEAGQNPIHMADSFTIQFVLRQDQNYYETAQRGNYDVIMSTWGGAAINPWNLMQVYCDSSFDQCCEYVYPGWQDDVTMKIDTNGNGVIDDGETKSMNDWYVYLNDTLVEVQETEFATQEEFEKAYTERHNQRLNVLAGIEASIISQYRTLPLYARGSIALTSFKVEDATEDYINLIGYGGIRFMTYNYTDGEWEAAWNDGKLSGSMYKN